MNQCERGVYARNQSQAQENTLDQLQVAFDFISHKIGWKGGENFWNTNHSSSV